MAKRFRLPPMKRGSTLIRIASSAWTGRTSAKAFWVPAARETEAALISRATRRLAIMPDKGFPRMHLHLRPAKIYIPVQK